MHAATSSIRTGNIIEPSTIPTDRIAITPISAPAPADRQVTKPHFAAPAEKKAPMTKIEIKDILDQIESHGYRKTNTNQKLSEFCAPNDQTIYAIHAVTKSDFISVMANPNIDPEAIRHLDGVASVDLEHRFHSNMPRFPKRKNNGKDEITYGWKVRIASEVGLIRFLNAFGQAKF
jgi:hypothetical protein